MANKGIDPFPHNSEAPVQLAAGAIEAVNNGLMGAAQIVVGVARRNAKRREIQEESNDTHEEAEAGQQEVENHIKIRSAENRHRIREIKAHGDVAAGLGELDRRHIEKTIGSLKGAKKASIKTPSGNEVSWEN